MTNKTSCCIVGGGPAGVVLGYLLARKGVDVTLLEAHKDFDRDFRGDTLHPATLELMDELGLADSLLELPHTELRQFYIHAGGDRVLGADFTRLRTRYPYIALMPQSQFLEFLVEEAKQFESFKIVMGANVRELVEEDGQCVGVRYEKDDEQHELRAKLTVAADGRFSRLRKAVGFEPVSNAPPMDVLWFRLPRHEGENFDRGFRIHGGHLVVLLGRPHDWQIGYVILKCSFRQLRDMGIAKFRDSLEYLVPEMSDRIDGIQDWKQIVPLSVESSRLRQWYRPGLLFIGDAAHVMSPVGGVGINYAIQDAVVAANVLTRPLRNGSVHEYHLAQVQRKRWLPTNVIQKFQAIIQDRIVRRALRGDRPFQIPWLFRLPILRTIPARMVGFGIQKVRWTQ